jgi:hypothetical protein
MGVRGIRRTGSFCQTKNHVELLITHPVTHASPWVILEDTASKSLELLSLWLPDAGLENNHSAEWIEK